ncbi:hypothetical protein EDD22DRAFT_924094 [Suillus occidentalis]|nr:hypothetical protein EDD22DRAFT_924094 [Suillus occidentalis]
MRVMFTMNWRPVGSLRGLSDAAVGLTACGQASVAETFNKDTDYLGMTIGNNICLHCAGTQGIAAELTRCTTKCVRRNAASAQISKRKRSFIAS